MVHHILRCLKEVGFLGLLIGIAGITCLLNKLPLQNAKYTGTRFSYSTISHEKHLPDHWEGLSTKLTKGEAHYPEKETRNISEESNTESTTSFLAPKPFKDMPERFLDNFKNPCWIRDEKELNCLPYFYVIGMRKCGTTEIWDKILRHPDVVYAPKEPHWWGPRRHGYRGPNQKPRNVSATKYMMEAKEGFSLQGYLNPYRPTVRIILNRTEDLGDGRLHHPAVFGDASISTATSIGLEWTEYFPEAREPPFTNADLIHALQPEAKIIMMIRNPTERVISWWWRNHKAKGVDDMNRDVHHYIDCFRDCLLSHNLRYCSYASGCPYNLMPGLEASIYHVYLQDWIKVFSRDGVHVIRIEDWKKHSSNVYRELIRFLELRQVSATEETRILRRPSQNVNRHKLEPLPETVNLLNDFFKPYNKELAKIIGYLY